MAVQRQYQGFILNKGTRKWVRFTWWSAYTDDLAMNYAFDRELDMQSDGINCQLMKVQRLTHDGWLTLYLPSYGKKPSQTGQMSLF